MKSRFLKVFRLFKFKKYGIPIGPPLPYRKKQLSITSGASPSKLYEDLNIVEERDDEDDKEP